MCGMRKCVCDRMLKALQGECNALGCCTPHFQCLETIIMPLGVPRWWWWWWRWWWWWWVGLFSASHSGGSLNPVFGHCQAQHMGDIDLEICYASRGLGSWPRFGKYLAEVGGWQGGRLHHRHHHHHHQHHHHTRPTKQGRPNKADQTRPTKQSRPNKANQNKAP